MLELHQVMLHVVDVVEPLALRELTSYALIHYTCQASISNVSAPLSGMAVDVHLGKPNKALVLHDRSLGLQGCGDSLKKSLAEDPRS
jgi:hypothetical protein